MSNLKDKEKNTIIYFKEKGLIYEKIPRGWRKIKNLDSPIKHYSWYNNGESRFSGKFKHGLVKNN